MRILVSNNTRKADLQRLLRRRGGELSAARFFCDDCNREHQSFELTCPLGEGPLTTSRLEELIETFHREHRRLYTYDLPTAPVELVNLRVTAIGQLPQRALTALSPDGADPTSALAGRRRAYFGDRGFVEAACYGRDRLRPGMTFEGPAIVDQDDATVLVGPAFRARVDTTGTLVLVRREMERP